MATLSVVVPCFNEKATIGAILDAVSAAPFPDKEIVVVDDGSTDGTRELLEGELRAKVDTLVLHDKNRGKGAALRSGFEAATGDIILVQDADLEYDPQDYRRLTDPILSNKADVVYGSRFLGGSAHRVVYYWHYVGNAFLTILSNMFTNINLTDMETGYKAFRRSVLEAITLEEDRFGFEPEITAKISKLQVRIYEVGISYYGRTYSEGKKIGWKDGVWAVWCIFKHNLFR